ncbi:MAG: chitinase, partial [Acidobacteria bacterium]
MKRALLLALLATACSTFPHREPRYRIVAYVYRRADMYRIGVEKLTHINYAFGLVNPNSEIVLPRDGPAHLTQLQALKAKNPKLKIILSVGGWGADNFSEAAFNQTTREKFAASAIALLKQYALDGL